MRNEVKGKKVLVAGLGISGRAAAEAMLRLGAYVSVQDGKTAEDFDPTMLKRLSDRDVKCYLGSVPSKDESYDYVIISPGISPDTDFILDAKNNGAEIIGELEAAYRLSKGKYIGITGTNGKTTTTTLVGEIFRSAGRNTEIVGNIGLPAVAKALGSEGCSWFVAEVSSFQLETVKRFKPVVSAILNLTPDHMNRHKTMENYCEAKSAIFRNQTSEHYCVINADDGNCQKIAEKCKATVVPFSRRKTLGFGVYIKDGTIIIKDKRSDIIEICKRDTLKIPGEHNLENALAAAGICYYAGIAPDIIADVMGKFKGVAHRLEFVGSINGIGFVNDSKGTNTDASIKAIEAMKQNIILIAGGYDKDAPFEEFVDAFKGRVKHAVLLGETAEKIKRTAENQGYHQVSIMESMVECVKKAYETAVHGDTILLSPACASWDMYKNYEERGNDFKRCIRELEMG